MGNHYHLVLSTRQPNQSRLMRHLNGVYTQQLNRRHGLVGHLFQGRFKAILVDSDAYLLTLCRYVERNPVAAGLVPDAADWPWSSYAAHVGMTSAGDWLDVATVSSMLLGRDPRGPADRRRAAALYAALVDDTTAPSPFAQGLRQQVFLGDAAFVERTLAKASPTSLGSTEVPRAQRKPPATFANFARRAPERDQALYAAYKDGGITMTRLAADTGLSVSRVSRIVAAQEKVRAAGAQRKR